MNHYSKKEKILRIDDLYKLNCLKIFYKYKNNSLPFEIEKLFSEAPPNQHQYQTSTQTLQNDLILTQKRATSEKTKNLLSFNLPVLINSMPIHLINLTNTHSFEIFKKRIKNHLLENYSNDTCRVTNCFSCNQIRGLP